MILKIIKFLLFICLLNFVNGEGETYRAAVVEYNVLEYDSIYDSVDSILSDYVDKIVEAKENKCEIIVFPEMTLNSNSPITIPDESENAQPWSDPDKYSQILNILSNAAHNNSIYVVVNAAERAVNQDEESKEKYLFFNTNFVLDPTGTIISRYRKINLYGEIGRSPSLDKKLGFFETNFGVKFGHFICFDLLFQNPAVQLLHKENVSNIVYPTMWFSEMPFLTAVQIQESWANTHNVNLLSAGANQPRVGSTGTGIYSGKRGRITAVMNGNLTSQLLYADVPKIPSTDTTVVSESDSSSNKRNPPHVMDNLKLKQDNLNVYKSSLLSADGAYTVKHGELSCTVNVSFVKESNNEMNYVYRVVAFNGVRSYTYATGGVIDCAVVACTNNSITSCGTRFANHSEVSTKNRISSIKLSAVVPKPEWNSSIGADNIIYHPVTLDNSIMPIQLTEYRYNTLENDLAKEIEMDITKVEELNGLLLTFGFTGRAFERDGFPVMGAGTLNCVEIKLLLFTILFFFYSLVK